MNARGIPPATRQVFAVLICQGVNRLKTLPSPILRMRAVKNRQHLALKQTAE